MQLFALTAHTRREDVDLTDPSHGPGIWQALRRRHPGAVACSLAPSRVELVIPAPSSGDAQRGLASLLARLSREGPLRRHAFNPVPRVRRIGEQDGQGHHDALRRCVIDVWRAPMREQAHASGHEAQWTTLRDAIGATASPWTSNGSLARALAVGQADLPTLVWTWIHARCVAPPPPSPIQARAWLGRGRVTARTLMLAAGAATCTSSAAVRHPTPARRVFVWLCYELGLRDPARIAQLCATDPASVERIARVVEGRGLDAGLVCAADPRLTAQLRRRERGDRDAFEASA